MSSFAPITITYIFSFIFIYTDIINSISISIET
nr:MAG TPA: hypothetical protein [Caudoviricetes sp.]